MDIVLLADNTSNMQPSARTKQNSRLHNTSDKFRMRVFDSFHSAHSSHSVSPVPPMHTTLTPLAVPNIEQYLRVLCTSPITNNSILPVQLLSTYATIPSRATEQSAGLDLYASFPATVPPHSSSPINTHIAIAIPTGHYGRVAPRSGLAFKSGVTAFGETIDADYRGELKVLLRNDSDQEFKVRVGDRIAQLIIEPYAEVTPKQATILGST
ncbi:hypothetical protein AX16_001218, partial [Volvariella volvacea WC 439]